MSSKKRKGIKTWILIEAIVLFGVASVAALCFTTSPDTVVAPAGTGKVSTALDIVAEAKQAGITAESDKAGQSSAQVNDQMILAALWMQRSAEYRALCYQAYNIVLDRLAWATVNRDMAGDSNTKPLAMILDCNDTVFTSIPSDAGLIGTAEGYTDELEAKWQSSGQVEAMPGATEFLKAVDAMGVQIFYVTNATTGTGETLLKLMQSLGFPQVEPNHMLIRSDTSDKGPRFARVAENFDVVVYLGDNINDMNLNTYKTDETTRNSITDANKKQFGVTRVMLPNPVYGNWESALAEGYNSLSLAEKDIVRRASLKTWRP